MNAPETIMQDETTLMIRRTFDTDIETLFDALTSPEAILHWFGPGEVRVVNASADLRVGGKWTIEIVTPECTDSKVAGEYIEIDAPNRVVFTWAWQSTPDQVSQVTYALSPARSGGGTTLTLTHQRLLDCDGRDRHGMGWNGSLDKLAAWLQGAAS